MTAQELLDKFGTDIAKHPTPSLRWIPNIENAVYRFDAWSPAHKEVRKFLMTNLGNFHILLDPRLQLLIDLQEIARLPMIAREGNLRNLADEYELTWKGLEE